MDATARLNIYINGDEGRKELYKLDKAYQQVTKKLNDLTKAGKENSKAAEALRKKQAELKNALDAQKRQIGITALSYIDLRRQYQALRNEWGKAIPGSPERKKLEKEMTAIQKQIDKVNFSVKDCRNIFEKGINGINKYAGALIVVSGALRKLGVEFPDIRQNIIDFDKTFRQTLGLLTDADKKEYSLGLKKGQIELIRQYGVDINDVNKALFDTISAGIPAANATQFMNDAMVLAVGGATDLSVSVDGLTSVMNAYGINATEAEKVSSAFFTSQKYGKTTVAELAANIGKVAPVAKSSGIAMEELMSVLAVITTKGIKTAEATTGLKAAISGLLKPSKDAEKVLRAYNVPVGATEIAAAGLGKTLQALNELFQQNKDDLSRAIPSVEAYNTVAALTGETLQFYDQVLQDVNTDTGKNSSLQKAYADNMESLDMQTKKATGELRAYILENETLKSTYLNLVKGTSGVIKFLVEHEGAVQRLILAVVAYAGAQKAGNVVMGVTRSTAIRTALSVEGLKKAFQGLTLAVKKNPLGIFASLAITVVYPILEKLIGKLGDTVQKMEQVKSLSEELAAATKTETDEIRVLYAAIKNSNTGIDERRAALVRLKEIVPGYLGNLTDEGVLIGDNARAIDNYIQKVKDMAEARVLAEAHAEATRNLAEAQAKLAEAERKRGNQKINSDILENRVIDAKKEVAEAEKQVEEVERLQKALTDRLKVEQQKRIDNMKRTHKKESDDLFNQFKQDMDALDEQLDAKIISQQIYNQKMEALEKDYLAKDLELKKAHQAEVDALLGRKATKPATTPAPDPAPGHTTGGDDTEQQSAKKRQQAYEQQAARIKQIWEQANRDIRRNLLDRKITQEQYDQSMLLSEELYYGQLKKMQELYGQDTTATEDKLLDIREKRQKEFFTRRDAYISKGLENISQSQKEALDKWIVRQEKALAQLEEQNDKFIDDMKRGWGIFAEYAEKSDNPYTKMVMDIKGQIGQVKDAFTDMKAALSSGSLSESIEGIAGFAAQTITTIGSTLNQILATENQIALQQEEARYNTAKGSLEKYYSQAIEAAAGNEEEQQRLREEYDQKKRMLDYQTAVNKLEIEKKQAKASFNINVAMATAQAALAIVQCYAQLGPIAGSIMAALVATTTALQIRAMKAQRDAILSQTIEAPNLSSSSSSSTGTASTNATRQITEAKPTEYVRGYEDGGYTHVTRAQDGRRFRARVAPHQRGYIDQPTLLAGENGGEFVANAEAVNNPRIRPVFDIIDQAQRRGTVGRLNMSAIARSLGGVRARGYAGGGYTRPDSNGVTFGDDSRILAMLGQLHEDMEQLKKAVNTDLRAHVVLSEINAMQNKLETAKNLARL